MSRVATEDTELGGEEIKAGERVTAWIGSANRDANVFDDPDEFYTLQLTIDEALV